MYGTDPAENMKVKILGTGGSWSSGNQKVISVTTTESTTWGFENIESIHGLFYNCDNLTSVPTNIPSSVKDISRLFYSCGIINSSNISSWDTTNVTIMYQTFYGCPLFNQDVGSWNTSNVTNMGYLFHSCSSFNNGDSGNNGANSFSWNTSNVNDMYSIFSGCSAFNQYLGSSWNTSKVTNIYGMFNGCAVFNHGDITNAGANSFTWILSNVTSVEYMFNGCSVFNQDITTFVLSKAPQLSYMFQDANLFNNGDITNANSKPLTNWNTSNITNMYAMFKRASAFNQDITNWDTSNVRTMEYTFDDAITFNQNIRRWDTSNVTTYNDMFDTATAMINEWWPTNPGWTDTSKSTPTSEFFNTITKLTLVFSSSSSPFTVTLPLTGTFNVYVDWNNNGTYTNYTSGSVSNTYNATNATLNIYGSITGFGNGSGTTWSGAESLTQVITNRVDDWGLGSSFVSLSGAFNGATKLFKVPSDIPSTITNLSYTFKGCTTYNNTLLTYWNVYQVTDMTSMFENATTFNRDIRYWAVNTPTLTNMFLGATSMISAFTGTTGFGTTPLLSFFGSLTYNFSYTIELSGSSTIYVNLPDSQYTSDTTDGVKGKWSDLKVDWGDGSTDSQNYNSTNTTATERIPTHSYSSSGTYTIVLSGYNATLAFCYSLGSNNQNSLTSKLTSITTNDSTNWAFKGLQMLDYLIYQAYANIPSLTLPTSIPESILSFKGMFYQTHYNNSEITSWNTKNITDMSDMFYYSDTFNVDIGAWNVSNVINMSSMFRYAPSFDQDISDWDVSNCTNMQYLFGGGSSLNQEIMKWSPPSTCSFTGMFDGCTTMASVYGPSGTAPRSGYGNTPTYAFFNYVSPTKLYFHFSGIPDGTTITIPCTGSWSNIKMNWGDGTTDGAWISSGSGSYVGQPSHTYVTGGAYIVEFSGYTESTSAVCTGLGEGNEWSSASYLTKMTADNSTWGCDTTLIDVSYLCKNATSIKSVPSTFPSQITNISYMFDSATSFNCDIRDWDVSNVTDMSGTFNGATGFNQDVRYWTLNGSTPTLTDMFTGASSLATQYDSGGVTPRAGYGSTPASSFFGDPQPLSIMNSGNTNISLYTRGYVTSRAY